MWSLEQIEKHNKVSGLLYEIKGLVFDFIGENSEVSEWEVCEFVLRKFEESGLVLDMGIPIVAFNESSANVHYYPEKDGSIKICDDCLIMIDIWARLNVEGSPYADITWMGFYGKEIPDEIRRVYDVVILARDSCLDYLRVVLNEGRIPSGKEIDDVAREVIEREGYGDRFLHTTGHSLGFASPHGKEGGLSFKHNEQLKVNLGYTIEPGIYLEEKFGVRSEICFYISEDLELVVTTEPQKEIELIG